MDSNINMIGSLRRKKLKERKYQLQTRRVGGTPARKIVLYARRMVPSVDSPCINGAKIKNWPKNLAVKELPQTRTHYQAKDILVTRIQKAQTAHGASLGEYNAKQAKQINVETCAETKKQRTSRNAMECPPPAKIFQYVDLEPLVTGRLKNANVARGWKGMDSNALIKKLEKQLPTPVAMLIFQLSLQASSLFFPMVAQSSQLLSKMMTNHPTNLTCF